MVDFSTSIGSFQQEAGFGFFGKHFAVSSANGITAKVGGGQRNSADANTMMNRVTVVGSGGDSVTLPQARKGLTVVVCSMSATSMNIMPGIGDQINNLGTDAAFAFTGSTAGKCVTFFCFISSAPGVVGQWQSMLGA